MWRASVHAACGMQARKWRACGVRRACDVDAGCGDDAAKVARQLCGDDDDARKMSKAAITAMMRDIAGGDDPVTR